MNTADYVKKVQAKHSAENNIAKTSRLFGVSRQTVYHWLEGKISFSEDNAIKAAELLDLDPDEVVVNIKMEGTQSPEARAVWKSILHRISGHAAGIMVAVAVSSLYFAPSSPGYAAVDNSNTLYYVKLMMEQPTTLIAGVILLISLALNLNTKALLRSNRP